MSEAIAFDTHRFVKRLIVTGFTEQQAETLAAEHVNLINSNLATKQDVRELSVKIEEIKANVEKFRLEFKADIAAAKTSILKWTIGALIAQGGVIVALIQLLSA